MPAGAGKNMAVFGVKILLCDGSYSAYRVRVGTKLAGIEKSQIVKILPL